MLTQYRNLLKEMAETQRQVDEISKRLKDQKSELSGFELIMTQQSKQYEENLNKAIDRLLDLQLEKITTKYDVFRLDLASFKSNIQDKIAEQNAAIDSGKVYSSGINNEEFEELSEHCREIKEVFEQYVPVDTIDMYTNLAYSINFKSKELSKISAWLKYFENYECFDELMGKVEIIENKINEKNDKWFLVICLIMFCAIVSTYAVITLPVYFAFISATLYLRCKEYYLLIKLLSVFNMINTSKIAVESKYEQEITEILTYEKEKVIEDQQDYKVLCDGIEANILIEEEKEKDAARAGFDREDARKRAEKELRRDDDDLKSRIDITKLNIEKITEQLKETRDILIQQESELADLKNKIISSYEQLTPSFHETELLKEFFLGFDKASLEPVTFNYGGEPTIIFFSGKNEDSYKAVITTLIMMSSQIMCIMSPTSYNINIVDTRTAGSQFSAFQITSEKEAADESVLFNVISTTKDTKKHITNLYNIFLDRRVKLLGHYEDIEDYNSKKTATGARPESFNINFFFNYDYKVLNETEEIQQICRVAKSVGLVLFFMIDTEKIGEEKELKYEELEKFLGLFNDENIFGFDIQNKSVEIVNISKEKIMKTYKKVDKPVNKK